GSIDRSATIMAPNERAFSRKHGPTPSVAMTSPAAAGPTMRAEWTSALLRLTALTSRSAPTISIATLWRVGLSTALTEPRAKTSAQTIHGSTAPAAVIAHRVRAGRAISVWVTIS